MPPSPGSAEPDKAPTPTQPALRTHFRPRTRAGRVAVVGFLVVFALTQPPAVNLLANRVAPWVLGLPFLYAYLLGLYLVLIGILLWTLRRGL